MTIVNTRDAEPRDARGIAEVHVRSWQAAYVGIVPDEELAQLSVDQREQSWTQILSKNDRRTFVLVNGDLVVGWSGFGPARDEDCDPALVAELYSIYLLPEYWTLGYGKQLYRATETRIGQNLAKSVVLWVFKKNARARRFYETIGYRLERGRRKEMRFARTTAVEIRYRKQLEQSPRIDGREL
jgi:ribosomal protein S18 acetylase RimI-like enzyme